MKEKKKIIEKEKQQREAEKKFNAKNQDLREQITKYSEQAKDIINRQEMLQQAKDYFYERDSFIENIGTNDYTYERELYLYEQQIPGHEIPTISTYNGTYFLEPELNNPYRTEEERENLQIEFDRFLEPEPEHEKEHNKEHGR